MNNMLSVDMLLVAQWVERPVVLLRCIRWKGGFNPLHRHLSLGQVSSVIGNRDSIENEAMTADLG